MEWGLLAGLDNSGIEPVESATIELVSWYNVIKWPLNQRTNQPTNPNPTYSPTHPPTLDSYSPTEILPVLSMTLIAVSVVFSGLSYPGLFLV